MRMLLPIVLLGTLLVACDGEEETPTDPPAADEVDLTGSWSGRAGSDTFEMLLSQDGSGDVVGAGSIQRNTGSQGFEVSGVIVGAEISLTLRTDGGGISEGETLINYRAVATGSGDRVDGTLNGGGFDDVALSITRQSESS